LQRECQGIPPINAAVYANEDQKVQTAPGGRVAVVQLPANVALLAPAFLRHRAGRFAIWQAGYKESLIWMFRCLYAHEVKCKQHNNKVGSLSAP
jgi:hypothetical protein